MSASTAAVVTYRGQSVENSHVAHVAVVDARGRLLLRWGDPFRMTLARSAAKPAQALAVMETGALDRFGFDDRDLALMCASHNSEARHIDLTRVMLGKVGASEDDLRCGGHVPLSDAVQRDWIKRDFAPTAVCSNCSGKHVGMLAGAQALAAGMADYHLPDHPMQKRVKQITAEACGLEESALEWGIDGCNLPTPAFSLDRLAVLYASLAQAADRVQAGSQDGRTTALARIYRAMTDHPELVAGEGRFCTALMRAFDGQAVGKVGADACYGFGLRESDQTRALGAEGALGLSVKIEDGNGDALCMIICEILERLGIGTDAQRAKLADFHHPKMLNTKGVQTGHVAFPFELQKA